MATNNHGDLANVMHHYAEVADVVNKREMRRFIEEIRQRWKPSPREEWDPEAEGYTDEGAFALCIYQEAFTDHDPDRSGQGPLCEAEMKNQVLLRPPVDAFEHEIPNPLATAPPQHVVDTALEVLRIQLQEQVGHDGITIEIPDDFKELFTITNGISGAGVPSETADTVLVHPVDRHRADRKLQVYGESCFKWRGYTLSAGWEIGCCTQHRQIYYVLCHGTTKEDASKATWKVFDWRGPGEDSLYGSIVEFLEYETAEIEREPGGHQIEHIINFDVYPYM